jgi:hypothetical protein
MKTRSEAMPQIDPLNVVYPTGWVHTVTGMEYHLIQHYSREFGLGSVGRSLTGPGAHGRYSLDQLLALATAMRYREAGWGPDVIRRAIQFVLDTGLEGIKSEIEAGRFHLALAHPRGPQMIDLRKIPPDIEKALGHDHANLASMLLEAMGKIKSMLWQPPPPGRGRVCYVTPKPKE